MYVDGENKGGGLKMYTLLLGSERAMRRREAANDFLMEFNCVRSLHNSKHHYYYK